MAPEMEKHRNMLLSAKNLCPIVHLWVKDIEIDHVFFMTDSGWIPDDHQPDNHQENQVSYVEYL